MADIYVRSTDGSDADNGSTWALAKATLNGAAGIDAAGDTIYVSQAHSESTAASAAWNWAGTAASPVRVIGASDAAEPPTAESTAPIAAVTGSNNLTLANTGHVYFHGINFQFGSGAGSNVVCYMTATSGATVTLEDCTIYGAGAAVNNYIAYNAASYQTIRWKNVTVRFASAGSRIADASDRGAFIWEGGGLHASGAAITEIVRPGPSDRFFGSGLDLSTAANTVNLFNLADASTGTTTGIFRDCKLPASWSGGVVTGTMQPGFRFEMHNCDSGDTNYRLWIEDYAGTIKQDTGIYSAASDGTTTLSWKLVSNANCKFPERPLITGEMVVWNDTTASSKTVTVEIARDGTTTALKDDEIWLEVMYFGTSGVPLGTWASDRKTDTLATGADQTSSSATWTGLGGTNCKQKLAVTFTPQEKGYFVARVALAKASTTVYVDPKLTVS